MRRMILVLCGMLVVQLFASVALAQADKLAGRWDGKTQSVQGERQTSAVFKKDGEGYTGTINILQQDVPLKDIKLEGKKLTAQAQVQAPQATVDVKYDLTLEGETLKGTGEVDFGGQKFNFDVDLKRVPEGGAAGGGGGGGAGGAAGAGAGAGGGGGEGQQRQNRPLVPQPVQKQSIDYFVGTWSVKLTGRESPLGMAPREGTITFTKGTDGMLSGRGSSRYDGGALEETITVSYDDATKMLTFVERRSNGVQLRSKGDWTSPLSIRFVVEPIKAGGKALVLRRTISVISPFSFSVVEELSEDGGPFVRLSNALYAKAVTN